MKIIIPLASRDKNFENKFGTIKQLCKVGETTMVEEFIKYFKFNYEYIFLCRNKDIVETDLLKVISNFKLKKKIVSIKHDTVNIIETVSHAKKYIKKNESILVAHPDAINVLFSKEKLIKKFKKPNCNAFLLAHEEAAQTNTTISLTGRLIYRNKKVMEIIEKSPLAKDSKKLSGVYYFNKWSEFLFYADKTTKNQDSIHGRHFISQVYNEYIREKKKVDMFLIKKHVDLGLVNYIDEFNFWHTYFNYNKNKKLTKKFNFTNVIPSCGDGLRFTQNKKNIFKPLINISNKKSMIKKTVESLPLAKKNVVIIRKDHDKKYKFSKKIKSTIKNTEVLVLNKKTSGMASTCNEYIKSLPDNRSLLLSSCDYSLVFNENKFYEMIKNLNPDVVIWTFKNYPDARVAPFAYAYADVKNGCVVRVSEKKPISNQPQLDHIVQGIFYFKSKKIFSIAFEEMVSKKNTVNNEYYVGNSINELIKKNYVVLPFQVDQYICLGTPRDLNVYDFWDKFQNDLF